MNTLPRPRRAIPNTVIAAAVLSLAFAAGCGASPGASEQFDTEDPGPVAACTDAELEPLVSCSAEPCSGLSGDPLNECMGDNCPETVFEVSEVCAECIIVNLSGVEDIVQGCGAPAQPTVAACAADEMDPLVACSAEPCAGLSGDPLNECMDSSCPETVWEVSEDCAQCIIFNMASVEAFAEACSG
jgi:hypothetical protein